MRAPAVSSRFGRPLRHRAPADLAVYRVVGALVILVFVQMAAYVCVRLVTTAAAAETTWPDRLMAVALLGAELFLCVHGIAFFGSMLKAVRHKAYVPPVLFSPATAASVAVIAASFNESEEVLEQTLASITAMDYPNFRVYLLDDSTKSECYEGAQRLAAKYGVTLVHRTNRKGYKAGATNDLLPRLSEKYVAILDADQRPRESWLKDIIPYLEADPRLALVQVPQVYVGTEGLPVAQAAKYQQAIFFEYICEGKSAVNAMFCCGSNAVLRRAALLTIGRLVEGRSVFFDETSVTEDIATSVHLHAAGWRTEYVNRTYVVGMGPETLPGYFTQQMRWAMGTMAMGLSLLPLLFQSRDRRGLTFVQLWEYLMSGTYYFVGFANFVFMLAPILFVSAGVRPLRSDSELYLLAFVPYIAFTLNLFYFGMRRRGYPVKSVWLAGALSFCTFWIYMKAALVALFGLKRAFGVTPKGVGGAIAPRRLMVELVLLAGSVGAALGGLLTMAVAGPSVGYAANTFWATYHAVLLSTLFVYFNRPVTLEDRQLLFEMSPPIGGAAAVHDYRSALHTHGSAP